MALTTRTVSNAGAPLHAPDGALLANTRITFELVDSMGARTDAWDALTNERVGGDAITATTDSAGEFSADLWPNSRGNRSTKYKCTVDYPGFRVFSSVVEESGLPLPWVSFMLAGAEMTPQEVSQLTQFLADIEAARDAAQAAADASAGAVAAAISTHEAAPDPHPQYVQGTDPRLTDARTPTGSAGGALSGSYPNPGFAVDMATQGELDAVAAAKVDKIAGKGLSTEDYSTAEKNKLAGVSAGANNYAHPANHPPSIITQDANNRFVTDAEKGTWNAKEPAIAAGTTAQYRRGDKTWQPVADLPVSTAQAAAIAAATAIHPFLLIGA